MGGLADLMSGLGGMGGGAGGGGGGMPDLASMMSNPMYMQMAQQLMANGGMERLMQNPSVANMVSFWGRIRVTVHLLTGTHAIANAE
jgi:small glutamine-rich tetratricopeptide repeat-containing protein alpha